MNFFRFCLIACLSFTFLSCTKKEEPVTLEKDTLFAEYSKEITSLEQDREKLLRRIETLRTRVRDTDTSPKFIDLLKKQLYSNERYLELINQRVAYYKIEKIEREKYIHLHKHELKMSDVQKQFEDYQIRLKANPESYPWRAKGVLPEEETPKPPENTHGDAEKGESSHH